ncbi:MAG: DUF4421 domain-containing protein [Bacteroidia bacterium]|nr:DUF4421 domain-containing protein [Bacteroidia bacterium]
MKFDSALIISFKNSEKKLYFMLGNSKNIFNANTLFLLSTLENKFSELSISYDKFTLSYTVKVPITRNDSKLYEINFRIGNIKSETSLFFYKFIGFEDYKTRLFDSVYYFTNGNYFYNKTSVAFFGIRKLHYIGYKKYAYKSPSINYRQLKSRGSFIFGGQILNSNFNFGFEDIKMVKNIRDTLDPVTRLISLHAFSLNFVVGAVYNLVLFKRFFIQLENFYLPAFQFQKHNYQDKDINKIQMDLIRNYKISLKFGYNGYNFFWFWGGEYDLFYLPISNKFVGFNNESFISTIGFRFTRCKIPKFYKNFKKIKLYKFL